MSFAYQNAPGRLSSIYTPPALATWLYGLTRHLKPQWILDPCVGSGNLIRPWFGKKTKLIVGLDVESKTSDLFLPANYQEIIGPFENFDLQSISWLSLFSPSQMPMPLVLCNPPFNGHWRKSHYPEVFLKKILDLFGPKVPIVFCCPMGTTLNNQRRSSRYRWMRDCGLTITSRIACPRDLYPDTEFHTEILLFNVSRVKPHYFLPDEVLDAKDR